MKKKNNLRCVLSLIVLLIAGVASAQYTNIVSGTVTDASTNDPICGVIVVCSTCGNIPYPVGTQTDIDGFYKLVGIDHRGHKLCFSCIGYYTQEKFVNNSILDVALVPDE